MPQAKFVLATDSAYRLDLTVWALRRRGTNAIDRWDAGQYSRILDLGDDPLRVLVKQDASKAEPTLNMTVQSRTGIGKQATAQARLLIQKMLGLKVDLTPFYDMAGSHEPINALATQFAGVRPPRFPSVFEGLVNAIACQQVTLDLGIVLLNRLAEKFGKGFAGDTTTQHAFPAAARLAEASEGAIKEVGFSYQKARSIKELATNVAEQRIDLDSLEHTTSKEATQRLLAIRGVGRWSAEYVLLRALGRLDTFPGDDVGAQNNLQRLFHLSDRPDYEHIRRLTSGWRPYQGVVYFHLLLDRLHAKGVI
ncbi:MAG TPA: DNA-3-methyladenine glycosylase 2 family protein [Micromonosporaceae bacterium]|nr:DNA-3-methyladenine glycosylase 2 family protein [Micromonosporaceae bacterium]